MKEKFIVIANDGVLNKNCSVKGVNKMLKRTELETESKVMTILSWIAFVLLAVHAIYGMGLSVHLFFLENSFEQELEELKGFIGK